MRFLVKLGFWVDPVDSTLSLLRIAQTFEQNSMFKFSYLKIYLEMNQSSI